MFLLSLWAVQEKAGAPRKTFKQFVDSFDWIAGVCYPTSVVVVMIAMVQLVSPTKPLDQKGPIIALLVVGFITGAIFLGK